MALQSKDDPKWFYAEAMRRPDTLDIKLRVAVRGHEGWVKVMDLDQNMWETSNLPTCRQVLENIQETITLELAKLTLEEL